MRRGYLKHVTYKLYSLSPLFASLSFSPSLSHLNQGKKGNGKQEREKKRQTNRKKRGRNKDRYSYRKGDKGKGLSREGEREKEEGEREKEEGERERVAERAMFIYNKQTNSLKSLSLKSAPANNQQNTSPSNQTMPV